MTVLTPDLLIIGAGAGGLSVAAGAVQMGARVVLVEGGHMGGDCLNYGCVPSKALIAAARRAQAARQGADYGLTLSEPQVDFPAVMAHVRGAIDTIAPVDSQERFEGLGVHVIRAYARFVSPTEVEAGEHRIRARRVVIATGSAPAVPPVPGLADVPHLTNETLWDLADLPRHLLILGGGPIGMEMAQAFRRLGSDVTVFEAGRALGREDPEAAALVLARMRAEGVTIHENSALAQVSAEGGDITATAADGTTLRGSHILVAAGRVPSLDKLNLPAAGVATTPRGVKVDAGLRSSNRRVYAIGDAAGGLQFTHVAGDHAGVVIRSALFGLPAKARTDHIPRVTYTAPELAQVGLTEAEARKAHGAGLEIARFDLAHNDRAIAERETEGFVKVMVHRGRPVSVTIAAEGAGELANLWALALANRLTMKQVSSMVSPYPTVGEASKRAAGAYFAPRLFANPTVKRVVGLVQRWLP